MGVFFYKIMELNKHEICLRQKGNVQYHRQNLFSQENVLYLHLHLGIVSMYYSSKHPNQILLKNGKSYSYGSSPSQNLQILQ